MCIRDSDSPGPGLDSALRTTRAGTNYGWTPTNSWSQPDPALRTTRPLPPLVSTHGNPGHCHPVGRDLSPGGHIEVAGAAHAATLTPPVGRKSSTGRRVHPRAPLHSTSATRLTTHPQNPGAGPRPRTADKQARTHYGWTPTKPGLSIADNNGPPIMGMRPPIRVRGGCCGKTAVTARASRR